MFKVISEILANENIDRVGMLDIAECEIINARILPPWAKRVIMFCIPYRSTDNIPDDGFSEYARIYDYHKYSSDLYERTINKMKEATGKNFQGFCDHSPINEKLAIAKCGLGVIGRNSLFIDDVYGSYVFLGSIMTDVDYEIETCEIRACYDCGLCLKVCPNNAIVEYGIDRLKCLSGISQKKKKTDKEKAILKQHNIVWGCDICQNICPHNKNALISPIPYFKKTRIPSIDKNLILSLSDEEFEKYAFSYKGRKIVLDNIDFT